MYLATALLPRQPQPHAQQPLHPPLLSRLTCEGLQLQLLPLKESLFTQLLQHAQHEPNVRLHGRP
jgi:hypothetical protein